MEKKCKRKGKRKFDCNGDVGIEVGFVGPMKEENEWRKSLFGFLKTEKEKLKEINFEKTKEKQRKTKIDWKGEGGIEVWFVGPMKEEIEWRKTLFGFLKTKKRKKKKISFEKTKEK